MAYSMDPLNADCYPGTAVLVNKFDIRDEEKLKEAELVLTSARYAEWLKEPLADSFDFEHYKAIHSFLFSDLYTWAGQVRTVNISKKGTGFTRAEDVESMAMRIFKRLKEHNCFKELCRSEFIDEIVDFYCDTNILHPFREGNGRVQRVFLTQLIRDAGYSFSFADMDTDLLMIATIQAAHGVTVTLRQIFENSIKMRG